MKCVLTLVLSFLLSFSIFSKDLVVSEDNLLILNESFNSSSVAEIMQQAQKLDANLKSGYPIYLFLYTPGGSIQDGLELFEYLKGLNRPVHTITLFAASMGFQTVQQLNKRYILKYGVLMSHKARGGFVGEFGDGISQLDSRYGLWLRRISEMDGETVRRSNGKQTLTSYRVAYSNELWLNGWEAVKQGYADQLVTLKCDTSLKNKTFSKIFNVWWFKVYVVFSKCPTNQNPLYIKVFLKTNQGEMSLENFLLKNGKFGKDCMETKTSAQESSYYTYEIPDNAPTEKENVLCASDPTLTLDKIKKIIKEKEDFFNRDLRYHIEYSY